jgi:vitamin B12 transporter
MTCQTSFFSFFVCAFFAIPSFCQEVDTVYQLPVAEVEALGPRWSLPGEQTESWNSSDLQTAQVFGLSDLLIQQGGAFLKTYGVGSLATSTVRGGSAGQTAFLWNGLPIRSPMVGQLDLALIPIGLIDGVQLRLGGNGAAFGSGAMSGTLSLNNERPKLTDRGVGIETRLGSFGNWQQHANARYGGSKWMAQTRLLYRQAENDFPYEVGPNLERRIQTHSRFQQAGILQSIYWTPDPSQEFALFFWGQDSFREIPPTMVQNQSLAEQSDQFLRTALRWKKVGEKVSWEARAGYFQEFLQYVDSLILLDEESSFQSALGEWSGTFNIRPNLRFQAGMTYNWLQAQAESYDTAPQQHRTATFAMLAHRWKTLHWQIQLRQELVDQSWVPLIPVFSLEWAPLPWLSIGGKASRDYRLPTLNDLYWRPGGNPDLQPETGWSMELGLNLGKAKGSRGVGGSIRSFNRQVDNWILWAIQPGDAFWSASNIAQVRSYGIESRLYGTYSNDHFKISLEAQYDWIRSVNQIGIQLPRIPAGSQLFYVPIHQGGGSVIAQWRAIQFTYRHLWTGSFSGIQFEEIPGYSLGFLRLGYQWESAQYQVQTILSLNNIWDTQYQIVEYRPNPGRHWQLGVRLQWKN